MRPTLSRILGRQDLIEMEPPGWAHRVHRVNRVHRVHRAQGRAMHTIGTRDGTA